MALFGGPTARWGKMKLFFEGEKCPNKCHMFFIPFLCGNSGITISDPLSPAVQSYSAIKEHPVSLPPIFLKRHFGHGSLLGGTTTPDRQTVDQWGQQSFL